MRRSKRQRAGAGLGEDKARRSDDWGGEGSGDRDEGAGTGSGSRSRKRSRSGDDRTKPLLAALENGTVEEIDTCCARGGADLDQLTQEELVRCFVHRSMRRSENMTKLFDFLGESKHKCLALKLACRLGDVDAVKKLLSDPTNDPEYQANSPLLLACEFNHLDVVKLLVKDPRVDPTARNDCALRWAAEHGNKEIVELLLAQPGVNPASCDNFAIRQAAIRGRDEVVELLLGVKNVDPSAKDNRALRLASSDGHANVVKLLLADPRTDPSARDHASLVCASKNGKHEVVKLLLEHPKVKLSTKCMAASPKEFGYDGPVSVGVSCLWRAVIGKHGQTVQALLQDKRIDPTFASNNALILAYKSDSEFIKNLFISRQDVQRCAEQVGMPMLEEYKKQALKHARAAEKHGVLALALQKKIAPKMANGESLNKGITCKIIAMLRGDKLIKTKLTSRENDVQCRAERLIFQLMDCPAPQSEAK